MERIADAPWIRDQEPYWNDYYGIEDDDVEPYEDEFDRYDEKHWGGDYKCSSVKDI